MWRVSPLMFEAVISVSSSIPIQSGALNWVCASAAFAGHSCLLYQHRVGGARRIGDEARNENGVDFPRPRAAPSSDH